MQRQMNQYNEDQVQKITPLIKIIKSRQQLYLSLLNFINKNFESSSNHHEQLTLFTKFLASLKLQERQIMTMEKDILVLFEPTEQQFLDLIPRPCLKTVTKTNKQILRLCARLIEILDTSISKTRHSIFNEDGHLTLQFNRFKKHLHNIIKGETIHLGQFTTFVLNFVKLKYKKQLAKVEKYIYQLQAGAIVALKELYLKEKTSPDDQLLESDRYSKPQSIKKIQKDNLNVQKQQKHQNGSETDSPTKKSLKKVSLSKSSTKKGHKLYKSTKKQKQPSHPQTKPKQLTANKLLKHYAMLQLSKKQFLEDMIYDKLQEEQHKRKLMNSLLQRNKMIQSQISTYYKKTISYRQNIERQKLLNLPSSGEQKEKKSGDEGSKLGMIKTSSMRKSFVISKRKSSLNFQKNSKILTENDQTIKGGDIFIKTVKNLPMRRKSAAQNTQRSFSNKSKKLFVIKSPIVFQDEQIPQAPNKGLTTGGWFRPPLTSRKPEKKNENIRLKKRNNPLPIENSLFNQSFKFTDNRHF